MDVLAPVSLILLRHFVVAVLVIVEHAWLLLSLTRGSRSLCYRFVLRLKLFLSLCFTTKDATKKNRGIKGQLQFQNYSFCNQK